MRNAPNRKISFSALSLIAALALISLLIPLPQLAAPASPLQNDDASAGDIWAWGDNTSLQLSIGKENPICVEALPGKEDELVGKIDKDPKGEPVRNANIEKVKAMAGGLNHVLALTGDGKVFAWGNQNNGQLGPLGLGVSDCSRAVPIQVPIPGDRAVKAIAAGASHSLALTVDNKVYAWGLNEHDELGRGVTVPELLRDKNPEEVKGLPTGVVIKDVAAGFNFSMALTEEGHVYAWGENGRGQLGRKIDDQMRGAEAGRVRMFVNANTELGSELSNVAAIAAGNNYSIALTRSGKVLAWGASDNGQLGNTFLQACNCRGLAAEVPGFERPVIKIAAGGSHGLAIEEGGIVKSWGSNGNGQLGLGNDTVGMPANSKVPLLVSQLGNGVTSIAAGDAHSLALKDGRVFTWGFNSSEQLGRGENVYGNIPVPAAVKNLEEMIAIAPVKGFFSLAIKPVGLVGNIKVKDANPGTRAKVMVKLSGDDTGETILDAGDNYAFGIVKKGRNYTVTPVKEGCTFDPPSSSVAGLSGVTKLDFTFTCSATVSIRGTVKDRNLVNLSGVTVTINPLGPPQSTQTDINGNYVFDRLLANRTYTVKAVSVISGAKNYTFEPEDGITYPNLAGSVTGADFIGKLDGFIPVNTVWAWGTNINGRLGLDEDIVPQSNSPAQVNSVSGASAIAGGGNHSLMLKDGMVFAWGLNDNGQLGDGTNTSSSSPVQVVDLPDKALAIAAGLEHNIALVGDKVYLWGKLNRFDQPKDGKRPQPVLKAQVEGGGELTGIVKISAGLNDLALDKDGAVWTWGLQQFGMLGRPELRGAVRAVKVPIPVDGGRVIDVVTNGNHCLALKSDGTIYAWGRNSSGQLGTGDTVDRDKPVLVTVPGPGRVVEIAAGRRHSLARKSSDGDRGTPGTVYSWGDNTYGELGIGQPGNRSTPQKVSGLDDVVVGISANGILDPPFNAFSMARLMDGTVWTWGSNEVGQLGIGSTIGASNIPMPVKSLSSVTDISAGAQHALVIVGPRPQAQAEEAITVSVRVEGATQCIQGANVTLNGYPTQVKNTDQNGNVVFTRLALHSDYTITPSSEGCTFKVKEGDQSISDLTGSRSVVFTAEAVNTAEAVTPGGENATTLTMLKNATLTQKNPVFDKRVTVQGSAAGEMVIKPLDNPKSQHYNGFVSKEGLNLSGRVQYDVNLIEVPKGDTEAIFAVGKDSQTWVRFRVSEGQLGFRTVTIEKQEGTNLAGKTFNNVPANQTYLAIVLNPDTNRAEFKTSANGSIFNALEGGSEINISVTDHFKGALAELGAGNTKSARDFNAGAAKFSGLRAFKIVGRFAGLPFNEFFVRLQYEDFLRRTGDEPGVQFWLNALNNGEARCAGNAGCILGARRDVTAAFFLSIEFQNTGHLVYRLHQAAFNKGERLKKDEFTKDQDLLRTNVVVGQVGWEETLRLNKLNLVSDRNIGFVNRTDFVARYGNMTNEQYVDALNANTGGALSPRERDLLVVQLANGTINRAEALLAAAEDTDFQERAFNKAFVLLQYFTFLQRNPNEGPDSDFSGLNFWLNKINDFTLPGDSVLDPTVAFVRVRRSQMIESFLDSIEYNQRLRRVQAE